MVETALGVGGKWEIIIGIVYEHPQTTGPLTHFLLTLFF